MRPAVRIVFAPLQRSRSADEEVVHGEVEGRIIRIDPRMPFPAKVLLHEMTHLRHPDWTEENVMAYEELRWAKMSWREKARLYILLGRAKLRGQEDGDT
jgi:hypothetical protein